MELSAEHSSDNLTQPVSIHQESYVHTNLQGKEQAIAPSARPPNIGARVYLIGDFLYWFAKESQLNFSYRAKGTPGQFPLSDVQIIAFNTEWNFGFRVGLGYRLPHDSWEARAYVTQYRTTNHLRQNTHASAFIQPNFETMTFSQNQGNWHLKYTLLDLELGRSFYISRALAISPFFGARAAWINQTLHMKFSQPPSPEPLSLHLEGKNNYDAGGLRLGTDLNFYLSKYIFLFSEASLSLLYGRFDIETELEQDFGMQDIDLFSAKRKPHQMSLECDLRGGIKGTIPLYRKEAYLTLGLTYDIAFWTAQNQFFDLFTTPHAIMVGAKEGDLTLQGLTLSTRLDF